MMVGRCEVKQHYTISPSTPMSLLLLSEMKLCLVRVFHGKDRMTAIHQAYKVENRLTRQYRKIEDCSESSKQASKVCFILARLSAATSV